MVKQAVTNPKSQVDARPIRPFSASTLWDAAVARRDAFADRVRQALAGAGVDALIFVSEDGVYPPWLRLEAWTPVGGGDAINRADLTITVDVRAYRRTPIVATAQLTRGDRKFEASEWPDFTVEDAEDWSRCALALEGKPRRYRPFRDVLRRLIASLAPFLSKPHANPIDRAYRQGRISNFAVSAAWIGLAASALAAVSAFSQLLTSDENGSPGMGIVAFAAAAVALGLGLWLRRRAPPDKHAVAVVEQPLAGPRSTALVDSWHAVIGGLGADYDAVRARLIERLRADEAGVVCREETYGHRVPNGFELRNRFVLAKHQAYVYVHIYRFGDDMFVGWQAFLNWAQWGETAAVSKKVAHGRQVEFRELRRALYVPSHIDIVELNSLSERVHRKLERELKAILKEKAIDQEIDFRVIRGDRESALDKSKHDGEKPKRRGGLRFVGFGGGQGASERAGGAS